MVDAVTTTSPAALPSPTRARALAAACTAHILHDGLLDLLYVLLPIWKVEFGLGYASLAFVRATYSAAMAAAQVPVDRMTSSASSRASLAGGTALTALGFTMAGASSSVVVLCVALAVAGLGASTQHPRGAAIVTETFGVKSRGALGIYNFAGDIGKAIFPAMTSLLLIALKWHDVAFVLAAIGALFAIGIWVLVPQRVTPESRTSTASNTLRREGHGGFVVLFVIGVLDTATRMGFLLFLPFILSGRGATHAITGVGLALVFVGGAFGKFTCGWPGDRLGLVGTVVVTEGMTAVLMLTVPFLTLPFMLALLPILGVALNGTSSVLYGTVPDVTSDGNVSRAFALFYTGVIGAGGLAPIFYGAMADHAGRTVALLATAATAISTIPLAFALQRRLH